MLENGQCGQEEEKDQFRAGGFRADPEMIIQKSETGKERGRDHTGQRNVAACEKDGDPDRSGRQQGEWAESEDRAGCG